MPRYEVAAIITGIINIELEATDEAAARTSAITMLEQAEVEFSAPNVSMTDFEVHFNTLAADEV